MPKQRYMVPPVDQAFITDMAHYLADRVITDGFKTLKPSVQYVIMALHAHAQKLNEED